MSAIERGAVIEYPAVFAFESYPRPYLIVSDESQRCKEEAHEWEDSDKARLNPRAIVLDSPTQVVEFVKNNFNM